MLLGTSVALRECRSLACCPQSQPPHSQSQVFQPLPAPLPAQSLTLARSSALCRRARRLKPCSQRVPPPRRSSCSNNLTTGTSSRLDVSACPAAPARTPPLPRLPIQRTANNLHVSISPHLPHAHTPTLTSPAAPACRQPPPPPRPQTPPHTPRPRACCTKRDRSAAETVPPGQTPGRP